MNLPSRLALVALALLCCLQPVAARAQSSLYVGGHFRRERAVTVPTLKASGLDTIILFNVDIDASGNLSTDGVAVARDGNYVFGASEPNYVSDVTSLKEGATSVYRIEACVGGWGNHSYENIRELVRAHGTGPGTNLYKNFRALKQAIPAIDAINNDDEAAYDVATATAFHVMLADLGYRSALAPYRERSYWEQVANNVNGQRPGTVDRVYIQVYDGGAGNNPCDWHFGSIPLHAGMLHFNSTETIRNQMSAWKSGCGVVGGFLWVYNAEDFNVRNYAGAINGVYKAPTPRAPVVLYPEINYGGAPVGLPAGDFALAQLTPMGLRNDDIASLRVRGGYRAELFWDDQHAGAALVRSGSDSSLVDDGWVNQLSSLKIRPDGATGLSGTYVLQNRHSQLVMSVADEQRDNGAAIQQAEASGSVDQQFTLTDLGDGLYSIIHAGTGKALDVEAVSEENFAKLHLWDRGDGMNQQFILKASDEGYYKLFAAHSGKIVEVGYASTEPAAGVNQYDDNGQACGQWRLVPLDTGDDAGPGAGDAGADAAVGDGDGEGDGDGDSDESGDGDGDDQSEEDDDSSDGDQEEGVHTQPGGCDAGSRTTPANALLGSAVLALGLALIRRRRILRR